MKTSNDGPLRRPWSVWVVALLLAFTSVNALLPGWAMVTDPTGASLGMTPELLNSPVFHSFLVPGIFLFTIIGLWSLAVAVVFLLRRDWAWGQSVNPFRSMHWAWSLALLQGCVIMLWIVIQYFSLTQTSFLQTMVFTIGLVITLLLFEPRLRRYYAVGAVQSVPATSPR